MPTSRCLYVPTRGFSLLEMLVVLILVGLVSVLLAQGLGHVLMLRERVLEHTQHQREDRLRRAWFTDAVAGLVADLPDIEPHRFEGNSQGFQGLSLVALQFPTGAPAVIQWGLEQDDGIIHLWYRQEQETQQRVWSWRADSARFSYYDPQTGWLDHWPPEALLTGPAEPLPAAIAFHTTWRAQPRTWLAAVQSARSPRLALRPPEEFRR